MLLHTKDWEILSTKMNCISFQACSSALVPISTLTLIFILLTGDSCLLVSAQYKNFPQKKQGGGQFRNNENFKQQESGLKQVPNRGSSSSSGQVRKFGGPINRPNSNFKQNTNFKQNRPNTNLRPNRPQQNVPNKTPQKFTNNPNGFTAWENRRINGAINSTEVVTEGSDNVDDGSEIVETDNVKWWFNKENGAWYFLDNESETWYESDDENVGVGNEDVIWRLDDGTGLWYYFDNESKAWYVTEYSSEDGEDADWRLDTDSKKWYYFDTENQTWVESGYEAAEDGSETDVVDGKWRLDKESGVWYYWDTESKTWYEPDYGDGNDNGEGNESTTPPTTTTVKTVPTKKKIPPTTKKTVPTTKKTVPTTKKTVPTTKKTVPTTKKTVPTTKKTVPTTKKTVPTTKKTVPTTKKTVPTTKKTVPTTKKTVPTKKKTASTTKKPAPVSTTNYYVEKDGSGNSDVASEIVEIDHVKFWLDKATGTWYYWDTENETWNHLDDSDVENADNGSGNTDDGSEIMVVDNVKWWLDKKSGTWYYFDDQKETWTRVDSETGNMGDGSGNVDDRSEIFEVDHVKFWLDKATGTWYYWDTESKTWNHLDDSEVENAEKGSGNSDDGSEIMVVDNVKWWLNKKSGTWYNFDDQKETWTKVDSETGNVGDAASGNVGDAASGNVGDAASGNVGDAASGNVGDAASGNVGNENEFVDENNVKWWLDQETGIWYYWDNESKAWNKWDDGIGNGNTAHESWHYDEKKQHWYYVSNDGSISNNQNMQAPSFVEEVTVNASDVYIDEEVESLSTFGKMPSWFLVFVGSVGSILEWKYQNALLFPIISD